MRDDEKQIDNEQVIEKPLAFTDSNILHEIQGYLTNPKDAVNFSMSCKYQSALFQPALKAAGLEQLSALLQAVIDDKRETVKQILDQYPKRLLFEPKTLISEKDVIDDIESKYTWQPFKLENAFLLALVRNQVEMVKILLPYFLELEGGIAKALALWKEADEIREAQEERSDKFDFQSIIAAIKDKEPDDLEVIFEAFRKELLPDRAVPLRDYYDIERLLIAAYQAYEKAFNEFKNWGQRDIFCMKVIGFIQSLLSLEDA